MCIFSNYAIYPTNNSATSLAESIITIERVTFNYEWFWNFFLSYRFPDIPFFSSPFKTLLKKIFANAWLRSINDAVLLYEKYNTTTTEKYVQFLFIRKKHRVPPKCLLPSKIQPIITTIKWPNKKPITKAAFTRDKVQYEREVLVWFGNYSRVYCS